MHQTLYQTFLICDAALLKPDNLLRQPFRRQKTVHQTVNRRNNRHRFPFQKPLNDRQTLSDKKLSVNIRTVKDNIPRRIAIDIFIKKAIILVNFFDPLLTVGNN